MFLFIEHRTEGKRIQRRIDLGLLEALVTLVKPLKRVEEAIARLGELGTRHEPATTAELQRQECRDFGRNWIELARNERHGLVGQTYQVGITLPAVAPVLRTQGSRGVEAGGGRSCRSMPVD